MASTEERVRQLISANLEVDGQAVDGASLGLDTSLSDAGVSSVDVAAFAGVVAGEFSVNFSPEQCNEINSLAQLVEFIDANAA